MNPEQPSREQIESRITALLLGELPAAEADLLRWAIAQDASLQKLHDELKSTIVLVREAVKPVATTSAEKSEPLKLSDQRRQKLLAHFKTPRPKPSIWLRPIVKVPRLVTGLALVALLALLAAMLLPVLSASKSRGTYGTLHGSGLAELRERIWGSDNSIRESAAPVPASATAPHPSTTVRFMDPRYAAPPTVGGTVTMAPEPVLAPPPVPIVLPQPEPTPEVAAQTGMSAESGNGGVYSQRIVGYVNTPLPLTPSAELPPGAAVPAAVETESGQLALGNRDATLHARELSDSVQVGDGENRQILGVADSSGFGGDGGGFGGAIGGATAPPPALNTPNSATMAWSDSGVNRSRAENLPGAAATTFAVRAPATDVYRYLTPAQPVDKDNVPSAGDVPALGSLFQSETNAIALNDGSSPSGMDRFRALLGGTTSHAAGGEKSLQDQFNEPEKDIKLAQEKVEALRQDLHITDQANASVPTPTLNDDQLGMFNQQQIEGQRILKENLAQLQELKSIQAKNPAELREVLPEVGHDAALNELLGKQKEAEQTLATNAQAEPLKDELNREIDDRVIGIMAGLESQVNSKKAALDELTAAVETAEQKDREEIQKNQPYYDAKRDLEQKSRMHELLYAKLQAEKLDLDLPKNSMVQITDRAEPAKNQTAWQKLTGEFESKARIKVENDVTDIAGMSGTPVAASYDPYFVQSTFEIIKSDAVLGKVVDALKLENLWSKKNGGEKLTKNEAISLLKKRLDLKPVNNTKLIEIGATSGNPDEAATLANAVAKAYKDYRFENRKQLTSTGLETLESQYAQQENEIRLAQAKVDALGKELKPAQVDLPIRKPPTNTPIPQPEIRTRENAFSTFSLNVSDVSFKLTAASLEKGQLPDAAFDSQRGIHQRV